MGGKALMKNVLHLTIKCPECNGGGQIDCYVDHVGDHICPNCGMVCGKLDAIPDLT